MSQYIKPGNFGTIDDNCVIILEKDSSLSQFGLTPQEEGYLSNLIANDQKLITINKYSFLLIFYVIDKSLDKNAASELARKTGFEMCSIVNKQKIKEIGLTTKGELFDFILPLAEGILLSNYQFLKYFKDADKKANSLEKVIVDSAIPQDEIDQTNASIQGTYYARTLVNEPLSFLTATELGNAVKRLADESGFSAEVFDKLKIESLKFGGLLAVNKGSIDPPTFSVLEWTPEDAVNEKPIVIVGKGVVYDTGGLSLKPTPNSMDMMKADMGGAAATIGAIYAVAKAKLPVKVIGLVPATDNRPSGNAYAPGDVVHMHSGLTVEVLNTDAEGRMLLADGLSYAQRYEPELTLDIATLTGAAARAIGKEASVVMGTAADETFAELEAAGFATHERIVRFPLWNEYGDQIKSDIADLKNIGGVEAGAITAGKFLEAFAKGDWIHIDIAGPMWSNGVDNYRGKGGSGVGVRLLFEFLKRRTKNA